MVARRDIASQYPRLPLDQTPPWPQGSNVDAVQLEHGYDRLIRAPRGAAGALREWWPGFQVWPGPGSGLGRQRRLRGTTGNAALKSHGWPSSNITATLQPPYIPAARQIQRSTRAFVTKFAGDSARDTRYVPGVFVPVAPRPYTGRILK